MKKTDLDEIIEESRLVAKRLEILDFPNKYDELSIELILAKIKEESEKITEPMINLNSSRPVIISVEPLESKSVIIFLKKVERRLRRIGLYEEHIRPALKNRYNEEYSGKKVINARKLLKYDDIEFVKALYHIILGRNADPEGEKHNLFLLRTGSCSKIDMLESFVSSDEGRNRGLLLIGVGLPRLKNKLKKIVLRIPILGYSLRLIMNIFLLPKRISQLQYRFAQLSMNKIDRLENSALNQENIIKHVTEQEKRINMLEDRLFVYEEEKNHYLERLRQQKQRLDQIYIEYEKDVMYKARDEKKRDLEIYIYNIEKWARGKKKESLAILDLGCGAGEWLELLIEHGYMPKGIDSNELMVSLAKKQNPLLDIEAEDALAYIKGLPDESLDIVSSFHMIEHLDLMELYELFDEFKRVLKQNGLLLLVTPNIKNILIATYLFRVDPTHKEPIPVEVLQFYLKRWGFDVIDTIFVNPLNYVPYNYDTDDPLKHIVFRFNLEQEYGVMAVKK